MICKICKKEFEGNICPEYGTENEVNDTPNDNNLITESVQNNPSKITNILKKKWFIAIVAVLAVVFLIGLFSNSGKSKETKNVIAEINNLSDISADSDSAIKRVERLYDYLNEDNKKDVNNYNKLKKARNKCDKLIAEEIETKIKELSSDSDISNIKNIRDDYNILTDNQKSFVSNYKKLDELESEYYARIINKTEKLINEITYENGAITETESQKIDEALSAYNQLDSAAQSKVNNYLKLLAVISERDTFLISEVQKKIDNAISTNNNYKEAKEAYNKLSITAQNKISGYDKIDSKIKETELNDGLSKQQIKIISTKYVVQDTRYKALYPDMLQVVLQNNSKSDIKNAVIGFVAWDSNKLPVKIKASGFDPNDPSYIVQCDYDDINLVSGGKFGNNYGFSVDENCNIKFFKAIVVSYETFEGETWENPLYSQWEELYAGKRLTSEK